MEPSGPSQKKQRLTIVDSMTLENSSTRAAQTTRERFSEVTNLPLTTYWRLAKLWDVEGASPTSLCKEEWIHCVRSTEIGHLQIYTTYFRIQSYRKGLSSIVKSLDCDPTLWHTMTMGTTIIIGRAHLSLGVELETCPNGAHHSFMSKASAGRLVF